MRQRVFVASCTNVSWPLWKLSSSEESDTERMTVSRIGAALRCSLHNAPVSVTRESEHHSPDNYQSNRCVALGAKATHVFPKPHKMSSTESWKRKVLAWQRSLCAVFRRVRVLGFSDPTSKRRHSRRSCESPVSSMRRAHAT